VEIEGNLDGGRLYLVEDKSPIGFSQMRMNVFIDSDATEGQFRELDEFSPEEFSHFGHGYSDKSMESHIHSIVTDWRDV
jgi:hypothetical protein